MPSDNLLEKLKAAKVELEKNEKLYEAKRQEADQFRRRAKDEDFSEDEDFPELGITRPEDEDPQIALKQTEEQDGSLEQAMRERNRLLEQEVRCHEECLALLRSNMEIAEEARFAVLESKESKTRVENMREYNEHIRGPEYWNRFLELVESDLKDVKLEIHLNSTPEIVFN